MEELKISDDAARKRYIQQLVYYLKNYDEEAAMRSLIYTHNRIHYRLRNSKMLAKEYQLDTMYFEVVNDLCNKKDYFITIPYLKERIYRNFE